MEDYIERLLQEVEEDLKRQKQEAEQILEDMNKESSYKKLWRKIR